MPRPRPMTTTRLRRKRAHLLWRIHRRFHTVTEPLDIGGLDLTFTRIADPDAVLDQVAAEEDRLDRIHGRNRQNELILPYWAQLWDSALGLGQWLVSQPQTPRREVLDLGCGMGLAGTIAARLGDRVTFADLEPASLLFAALNSLPDAARVRTHRLNWQTERLPGRFDLILGADILYERQQWPHLQRFWAAHLAPGAMVLLGEPGRQTGELFLDWIRDFPWEVQLHEQPVATRQRPIRIFRLTPTRNTSP
jgi:predicted nicotinamide N-methyase